MPPHNIGIAHSLSMVYRICRYGPHLRAIYGTGEPFTRFGGRVRLFLSSTWGRADQQTSRDSNRVRGAFCFVGNKIPGCAFRVGSMAHIARPSHLPDSCAALKLFSSSTWGRADQQTSQDSNRVRGAFCFVRLIPVSRHFLFLHPSQVPRKFLG